MKKTGLLTIVLIVFFVIGGVVIAAPPKQNVNPSHHPNLAAAQQLSREAWDKIVAAQKANEWDMQGHAQKAKNLLDEVNKELKLAAEAANKNAK